LRLNLRWELRLQNTALARVPIRNLKRYRLESLFDLLFGGLGVFSHAVFLYDLPRWHDEVGRISGESGRGCVAWAPVARSIEAAGPSRFVFGLRQDLWPVTSAELRVANGLSEHLAQFSLRLRWFPNDRCLPVSHRHYVGMPQ
jgi:hypothetical protein